MAEERCETCLFYLPRTHDGICRKNPPTVIRDRWENTNGDPDTEIESLWPPVYPGDWCGAYDGKARG